MQTDRASSENLGDICGAWKGLVELGVSVKGEPGWLQSQTETLIANEKVELSVFL